MPAMTTTSLRPPPPHTATGLNTKQLPSGWLKHGLISTLDARCEKSCAAERAADAKSRAEERTADAEERAAERAAMQGERIEELAAM
ncbi:hypothetical protein AJ80_03626 [Polytolypa hystricis UAMH7299]|uniref:Uncharacterized protein n=1 Tax=Polytolypa hystricis (strain UAMH7299) TaxID=1447883 RepID=A0A2B7YHH8_POLH7|nr:hypothetical protein AJ80_03626 [Polytolypa hystricis UAMH7299]